MNNKAFLIVYYASLLLLLIVTWANTSLAPLLVRILYMGLVFIPLISNEILFAPCLILFWAIAHLSLGYSLMPTDSVYYIVITLFFVALSVRNKKKKVHFPYPFLITFCLYVLVVNLVTESGLEKVTLTSVLFLLLLFTVSDNISQVTELVGYAFILVSLISSGLVFIYRNILLADYSLDIERIVTGSLNYSCTTLGIGAVSALSQALDARRNKWWRLVCVLTIIISIIALLLQASRGAILAVAVAYVAIIYFHKIKFIYKLLTIALIGVFVFCLYEGNYFDLLLSRIQNDDSGSHRLEIWQYKLSTFHNNSTVFSYLFGIGLEQTWQLGGSVFSYIGCHNDFVAFYIEYGIVGIIMFLSLICYPLVNCPKSSRFQIIPFLLFIIADCISLEPYSIGYAPMYFLLFYLYLVSANNKEKVLAQQMSNNILKLY